MPTSNSIILLRIILSTIFFTLIAWHFKESKKEANNFSLIQKSSLIIIFFSFITIALLFDRLEKTQRKIFELKESELIDNYLAEINKEPEIPPVKQSQPPEQTQAVTITTPESDNGIKSLFTASENDADSKETNIKQRYEETFITYFLMQKCGKIADSDYQAIISSLQREIASANSSPLLQNEILLAAKGSYQELYSQNDCNNSAVNNSYNQYKSYISAITTPQQATSAPLLPPDK